jgi:superfamily II DNA/RNA helicase
VGSAEDIPTVDIVVCYDMPDTIDEYERRIGRARSNGMATSFLRRRSIGQSACRSALARGGRRRSAIM